LVFVCVQWLYELCLCVTCCVTGGLCSVCVVCVCVRVCDVLSPTCATHDCVAFCVASGLCSVCGCVCVSCCRPHVRVVVCMCYTPIDSLVCTQNNMNTSP